MSLLLSPIYFFLSAGHVLLFAQENDSDLDRVGSVPFLRASFVVKTKVLSQIRLYQCITQFFNKCHSIDELQIRII
jgi:hypothetical protein